MRKVDQKIQELVTDPAWGMVSSRPQNIHIHPPFQCEGRPCTFHNPSDHPLKNATKIVRMDKHALVERLCQHGIAHDDPDSVAWLHSIGETWAGIHGCDGCCQK